MGITAAVPLIGPYAGGPRGAKEQGLTWELLLEDGGEGGQQVLQQLRQPALEQAGRIAVRLRLHHHLAGKLLSVRAEKAPTLRRSM